MNETQQMNEQSCKQKMIQNGTFAEKNTIESLMEKNTKFIYWN